MPIKANTANANSENDSGKGSFMTFSLYWRKNQPERSVRLY